MGQCVSVQKKKSLSHHENLNLGVRGGRPPNVSHGQLAESEYFSAPDVPFRVFFPSPPRKPVVPIPRHGARDKKLSPFHSLSFTARKCKGPASHDQLPAART